jgi:adenine-specific DNA-methyltransferase
MPTINFKGKNAVWNHHLSLPYQILEKDKKLSVKGKNEDGNLIIEADNLIALKSLLPKYQEKIKCIYIDPPYNTGNENWVYNDKVNSPLLRAWIGEIIGKDDLTKHDKWLCMMVPRLKLLREFLNDEGVIFISIDNNEEHHLRNICDEIFMDNFIAKLVWKGKSGAEDDNYYRTIHEYILVYAKNKSQFNAGLQIKEGGNFPKFDQNKEKYYTTQLLRKWGSNSRREDRPNLFYPIKGPDGNDFFPRLPDGSDGCWRWDKSKMIKAIENGDIDFAFNNKNLLEAYEKIYEPDENENRFKKYQSVLDNVGSTTMGTKELMEIFDGLKVFDHPKPTSLLKRLFTMSGLRNNDIILDSFAGSGTTAHAVLELNKEDGGNRKFILVQLPEKIEEDKPAYKAGFKYIHEITRERVKRVIEINKLEVGFSYMRLGPKIDADSILNGDLPTYNEFAKYVYYLATGKTMDNEESINEKNYFVGKINSETVYLIYEKDTEKLKKLAITLDWAEEVNKKDNGNKIVYAPACFLDEEYLERFNISFVSIPYNLFEKK